MKFNTKNLNPGAWFFFNEKNHEEGGVCLRKVTADKMKEISKQTQTIKTEYRKRIRHEVVKRDETKEDFLLWDYCIVDWKVVEDDDGTLIDPTAENKSMLMGGSPGFAGFVADKLEILSQDLSDREEGSQGN